MKHLLSLLSLLLPLLTTTIAAEPLSLTTHSTIYQSDQSAAGTLFDIQAKSNIVIYGLDINVASRTDRRVRVYTKPGSFKGSENEESDWELVLDATVKGNGADEPTPLLNEGWTPVVVAEGRRQAFYVDADGPYLRYSSYEQGDRMYYINHDIIIYGKGVAKRKGWGGGLIEPRVWNGGIKYVEGVESVPVSPQNILGLPTVAPTASASPTKEPTPLPTNRPTPKPTSYPSASPQINTNSFTSTFQSEVTYAGVMFDIVATRDIEIKGLGFNTYRTGPTKVQVYTRRGSYKGVEKDRSKWNKLIDTTLVGAGLDQPTMIPTDTFRRVKLKRGVRQSFYVTTPEGPYMRASKSTWDGDEADANEHLIYYKGVGKRIGFEGAAARDRIANSVIVYEISEGMTLEQPPIKDGMETTSYEFFPTDATYIQNESTEDHSGMAQMLVDGRPKRITLLRFDLSALTLSPVVIKRAKIKLYAMTDSQFGGEFSIFPDGDFHQNHVTWENSPYSTLTGIPAGVIDGPVEQKTFYLKDITKQFVNGIPSALVVRIASDNSSGVMYRSPAGDSAKSPVLQVVFASDPAKASWIELFGTYAPTPAPTVDPEWDNPQTLSNPGRDYFNYNPRSRYGPNKWDEIDHDGWYDQYWRLDADLDRNRCLSGERQSPQDLCQTWDRCEEFHEPRTRAGEYDIDYEASTKARPTPYIMHNKLRLSYRQRRSEWERPEPPGTDFAHNVFQSGIQDVIHIDFKVKSEHRLCGKQYDGEMQIFHLHGTERNLEATGILIEVDNNEGRNPHFQKVLDFFEKKFKADEGMCRRRQLLAKKLFDGSRNGDAMGEDSRSKLRGLKTEKSQEPMMVKPAAKVQLTEETDAQESSDIFHGITDRFLNLLQRRTARDWVWDPFEPWYILRTIHFWAYSGSTTEPPCFEGVNWRIMDVPIKITYGQLIQLQKLMFDHVDPDTCAKTSTHYEESNARPVQPYRGGRRYRCRRSDYVSDKERQASGLRKGFNQEQFWCGVKLLPWVEPEFPTV